MKTKLAILAGLLGLAVIALIHFTKPVPFLAPITTRPTPNHITKSVVSNKPYRGFILGGVHDVDQFRRELAADAALSAQFPNFAGDEAHFEVLKESECVYIAYRKGNSFAWTPHCKMLYAGELILTDGQYRIRAACGNKLSFAPQAPTIPSDDPGNVPEVTPMTPEPVTPVTPTTPEPVTPVTPEPGPSPVPPIGPPTPPIGPPSPPPMPPPIFCCEPVPPPVTKVPDGDNERFMLGVVFLVILLAAHWRKR